MSRRLVSAIVGLTLALGSPGMTRAQVVQLSPTVAAGQRATRCDIAGPWRRITPLGRWSDLVPLGVRWADPLLVSGSNWYVNVSLTDGGHAAHRMIESQPDHSRRTTVQVERDRPRAAVLAVDAPVSVALSLGSVAPNPADPHVVSNVAPLSWSLRPGSGAP